jgi:hypothetical protein
MLASVAHADDVRAWRDKRGQVHVTIEGTGEGGDAGAESAPPPRSEKDDRFSTETSLRRRELEKKLVEGTVALSKIRADIAQTEKSAYLVEAVPTPTDPEEQARWSDLRRNALLMSTAFEEEKRRRLFSLRRQERATLRELHGHWSAVDRLRNEVRSYYGKLPTWWIDRVRCVGCPSFEEIEQELAKNELEMAGKAEATPTATPTPE